MKPSQMASLSNSRWQARRERPNRSTTNGDMAEKAKCYVVCEGVSESVNDILVREKRRF